MELSLPGLQSELLQFGAECLWVYLEEGGQFGLGEVPFVQEL